MIKINIGKGKGNGWKTTMGLDEIDVRNHMRKKQLQTIVREELKKRGLKNGEVEIYGISFSVRERLH